MGLDTEVNLIKITSSNIEAVGYAEEFGLVIQYKSGIYIYPGATREVYDELLAAQSKGKYVASNIKGKYIYRKIAFAK